MLFAVLAAALASPIAVVSSDAPSAVACPVVEVGSGASASGCGEGKEARALVVDGARASSRRSLPSAASATLEPRRIRLDTVARYGPEDERAVTISLESTPEQAAHDLVILREVASKVESYPTWRAREY